MSALNLQTSNNVTHQIHENNPEINENDKISTVDHSLKVCDEKNTEVTGNAIGTESDYNDNCKVDDGKREKTVTENLETSLGKHSYDQLHGASTSNQIKGHHEESQLKGSSLERRRSSTKGSQIIAHARGSLKTSQLKGVEFLTEKTEVSGTPSVSSDLKCDVVKQEKDAGMIPDGTRRFRQAVIMTQPAWASISAFSGRPHMMTSSVNGAFMMPKPKPMLQRRKSLNPRMMTPPGLEILEDKSLLAVRQQMEMDIKGGCGVGNTYRIWDINDEQLFFATEDSSCVCRWACGPSRKFSLDVFSTTDDQVLTFHRSCCRCDCCCCLDCLMCLQKLYVVDCLGRTLGAVKQKFSVFNAKFDVLDHDNNVLFKILGPCCPCRCSTEIYFQILDKSGERQIGRIQKKWGGDRTDSVNVDHEYFDITFPVGLDAVDKALILGASFLVNFMYLEMS